ncbi:hypothetical protein D6855_01120 [Butyrivibrio sp. CB08]|uniref:hypothetical protein n=1 Tax=Butyrivibrio sp. CB08 TaxID=2364879 RepID=UPI000EA93085|nr:hypothetical protein [Butyrivibrio sp. CB08]RKM62050.1 hypothetical protein D6855_01120 [Butyrivibrio sp. CB08]
MKLTGELKDKVGKAETKEQVRDLISKAGIELNDEELDNIAGGLGLRAPQKAPDCTSQSF